MTVEPISVSPAFIRITPGLRYTMQSTLQDQIRATFALLVGRGANIRPGERAAIKINLTVPALPEAAAGTHPEVLRAAIIVLQELGAEVLVVEDCEETALPLSGVAAVVDETGVAFHNLRDHPYQIVRSGAHSYAYAQDLLQADHVISLPKLKTHLYTYYTGAIKNMYGCIPKAQRRDLHREMATGRFSEHLVDIYAIRPPDLVILDGILAMEGIGPTHGIPKMAGLLLAGDDGVLLDHCAATLMGYDPNQIEMIRIALQRGLHRCPPEQVVYPDTSPSDIPKQGWNRLPVAEGTRRKRIYQALYGPFQADLEICDRCGICAEVCSFGAIRLAPGPEVDRDLCEYCFCCLELCPQMAIHPSKFQRERMIPNDRSDG